MKRGRFSEEVYRLTSMVPAGKVTTYGALAAAMGKPASSRAVGGALRANPHPIVVPCHRVVKSSGELGGYGGSKGTPRKAVLLSAEGVKTEGGMVDLSVYGFTGFPKGKTARRRAS